MSSMDMFYNFQDTGIGNMAYLQTGLGQIQTRPISSALEVLTQLPQTQRDITQFAQSTQYLQSPQFQEQVKKVTQDIEMYTYAQLGLQTVATIATFGLFLIALYTVIRKRGKV